MTGKHTGHTTIRGNRHVNGHDMPLSAADVTVAQVLKKSGYKTGAFGKWGLGYDGTTGAPWTKGFDRFFGYLGQGAAHNYYPRELWNYEANKASRQFFPMNKKAARGRCMNSPKKCTYSHDEYVSRALDWVKEQRNSSFFLYLG